MSEVKHAGSEDIPVRRDVTEPIHPWPEMLAVFRRKSKTRPVVDRPFEADGEATTFQSAGLRWCRRNCPDLTIKRRRLAPDLVRFYLIEHALNPEDLG